MKTKRNSAEYSFLHTQQRLQERYGLEITKKEYQDVTLRILQNLSSPDYTEVDAGERQGIYTLQFKGKSVIFVFSLTHIRIKTVLPPRLRGW